MTTNQRDLIAAIIILDRIGEFTDGMNLNLTDYIQEFKRIRELVGRVCEEMENESNSSN